MSPSEFQLYLLGVVRRLQPEAYGVTIHQKVKDETARDLSFGALYAHLNALEASGYVESYTEPGGPERDHHDRRYWRPTDAGRRLVIPGETKPQWLLPGLGDPKPA